MIDLKQFSPTELLALHSNVAEALRERGVVRSANNPTGDLAEYLFCEAFKWKRTGPSHPCADAVDGDGKLYQIKGRRWTRKAQSRQLGALRDLPNGGFDYLAAVLFTNDYAVQRAIIIPHALVHANSKYGKHTNSWRFMLYDAAWKWAGVEDATERLRSVKF